MTEEFANKITENILKDSEVVAVSTPTHFACYYSLICFFESKGLDTNSAINLAAEAMEVLPITIKKDESELEQLLSYI